MRKKYLGWTIELFIDLKNSPCRHKVKHALQTSSVFTIITPEHRLRWICSAEGGADHSYSVVSYRLCSSRKKNPKQNQSASIIALITSESSIDSEEPAKEPASAHWAGQIGCGWIKKFCTASSSFFFFFFLKNLIIWGTSTLWPRLFVHEQCDY